MTSRPRTLRARALTAAIAGVILGVTVLALPWTPPLPASAASPSAASPRTVSPRMVSPGTGPSTLARIRTPRPNIVMVMADDMRTDDLRYMPNVRRLVRARGLLFRNSFSPYPLCCPARASFLTGMYSHNHHVFSHEAPWGFGSFDDRLTLATALRRSGYRTAFVGKYLNNYGADRSLVTGRSSWHYVPNGWTDWYAAVERPKGSRYRSGGTYNYFHTIYNVNGRTDDTHAGRYQTRTLGGFARNLVGKYSRSRAPFFLYLSSVAPHFGGPRERNDPRPVLRDDGGYESFRSPARPRWVRGRFDHVISRAPGMPTDGGPAEADISDKPEFMRSKPEMNAAERVALTAVARQRAEAVFVLDREVGRLVQKLKDVGELRNTVIMFTSDNGYFMGEHRQRTGKVKAHEPSLRVPFLVAGPGIPRNQTRFDPITTVDVTATIIDLANAGRHRPHAADGTSKLPVMRSGDRGWRIPVVTEGRVGPGGPEQREHGFLDARTSIGIRTARYSYIKYAGGAVELYDLDRDPNELENVAEAPTYADTRAGLDLLWYRYKDCRGSTCRALLPPVWRTAPAALRRATNRQSLGVEAVYGYWR